MVGIFFFSYKKVNIPKRKVKKLNDSLSLRYFIKKQKNAFYFFSLE